MSEPGVIGPKVYEQPSVADFERFFRAAAGLDVDKEDLKRYTHFVGEKVCDLLIVAHARAKASGRDMVEPFDLPITKGLQESVHRFERIAQEVDLRPLPRQLTAMRPQEVLVSGATEARLPGVAGGLSVALAVSFKILDPDVKNPQTAQWDRAFRLFDLLL